MARLRNKEIKDKTHLTVFLESGELERFDRKSRKNNEHMTYRVRKLVLNDLDALESGNKKAIEDLDAAIEEQKRISEEFKKLL